MDPRIDQLLEEQEHLRLKAEEANRLLAEDPEFTLWLDSLWDLADSLDNHTQTG